MIIVNYKTYKQSSLGNSQKLTLSIKEVVEESRVEIIACPASVDIKPVADVLPGRVWAQHVDPEKRGRATGWLPVELAKEAGASGVLLNHSEHKLSVGVLGETLNLCKQYNMTTLVFADGLEEAKMAAGLGPDYIGYEPPELIASPDTSVARAKPEVIEKVVKELPNSKIVVGAGVKDEEDIRVSLKLGAIGVALASGVILADNPKQVLRKLAGAFKN
jgi:triosephosphate isomerase